MKRICSIFATLSASFLIAAGQPLRAETIVIDLTRWTPPDISTVGDDPFGKLVKYGHQLFADSANEIGPFVSDMSKRLAGNNLACGNCHLQAGTQPYAKPMIGVWGQFPQYRAREGTVVTLEERINGCMQRSMHGRALSLESREMKAFSAYMRWLSQGVPDAAMLLGAGTLQIKEPTRASDPDRGAEVYTQVCAACHGADGLGQHAQNGLGYQFPHIVSHDRPKKENLDEDFPIRLQKPIDTPYGPYADGFSAQQHTLGPFGPIRARVKELAAESRTTNAGEPDNGSHEADTAR
jgi:thiosulfate dehydrogenase